MPYLYKKCAFMGCQEKILDGSYCQAHRKQVTNEYNAGRNPDALRFYNSRRWKLLRQMKLNRNPLCESCLAEGKVKAADVVDHADANISNNDDGNLRSLCNACHNVKHKAGKQPASR